MIIQEDNVEELRNYLINVLAPISDADNEALTEYIISLIMSDKDVASVKQDCLDQLEEFLEDKTHDFINNLFSWLESKHGNKNVIQNTNFNSNENGNHFGKKRDHSPTNEFEERRTKNRTNETRLSSLKYQRPCRYFADTGYCKWGENCHYSHEINQGFMTSHNNQNDSNNDYNPHNTEIVGDNMEDTTYDPNSVNNRNFITNHFKRGGFNGRGRSNNHNNFRGGFHNLSTVGPNNEKRIICNNIPRSHCNQDMIMEYFSRFGEIIDIQVDQIKRSAEIEFKTRSDANKAVLDKSQVFDDEYVSVAWKVYNNEQPAVVPQYSVDVAAMREEKIKSLTLLIQKKTELVSKQLQNQKDVMNLIEDPNTSETNKKELMQTLNQIIKSIKEQMNSIEAEEKLLASLKYPNNEDISNNGNFNNNMEVNQHRASYSSYSSNYRPPAPHYLPGNKTWVKDQPEPRKFKLDNRPKSFLVTGFNQDQSNEVEQHLKGLTAVENVVIDAEQNGFVVSFPNSFYAIKAYSLSSQLKDYPLTSAWIYAKSSEPQPTQQEAQVEDTME